MTNQMEDQQPNIRDSFRGAGRGLLDRINRPAEDPDATQPTPSVKSSDELAREAIMEKMKVKLSPTSKETRDRFEDEGQNEEGHTSFENFMNTLISRANLRKMETGQGSIDIDAFRSEFSTLIQENPVARRQLNEIVNNPQLSDLKNLINDKVSSSIENFNLDNYIPAEQE